MNRLYLYYYTLRDLDLIQIIYRLIYIVKRKVYESLGDIVFKIYKIKFKNCKLKLRINPIFKHNTRKFYFGNMEKLLHNKITFLNKEIFFGNKLEWHKKELNYGTRLWKLNLHYHEFLIDIAVRYQDTKDTKYLYYLKDTIDHWIDQNPIGTKGYGNDNWNSYCISLRVVSWIRIYSILGQDFEDKFEDKFIQSLWIQSEFLYDNLEIDILGNHLIKNYKALYWSGDFFENKKYKKSADKIFNKYIKGQFTNSGMHEELSPMYAGIILEDLIEVYLITKSKELGQMIRRQYTCLQYLVGSDNKYTFFNDSVYNNGIDFSQVQSLYNSFFLAKMPSRYIINFDGYYGISTHFDKFIFDAGSIVEGNQAGHGHCDALSFEYFLNGNKIFTNSGVFEYNSGQKRDYSRSTRAHNTLAFDKINQSEVWSSFRVARKASVSASILELTCNKLDIIGTVTGFDFNDLIEHKRRCIKERDKITFIDTTSALYCNRPAKIYYHLMPNYDYLLEKDKLFIADKSLNKIATVELSHEFKIKKTPLYTEFGLEELKSTLVVSLSKPKEECITIIKIICL